MPWSKIKEISLEPPFQTGQASQDKRELSYPESIREALESALEIDPDVFVMGQGINDPNGIFGISNGLREKFGIQRVFDTPLAESALTGISVGAALGGMHPVYLHNRPDFLMLAMDQLVNHATKWNYMFNGKMNVPMVIWACIGRGWGSAAQHSQALQGLFFHIPGLKLVMPCTCFDAKGLMLAAITDKNPVLILDHRFNFKLKGMVPKSIYKVPIGEGVVRKSGKDVTVLAISHLVLDSFAVANELAENGIDVEVIDPRSLRPFDEKLLVQSVQKTGRLVIVDNGWRTGGVTAEIAATIAENTFDSLKAPIIRVTCPDIPTPSSHILEEAFYIGQPEIKAAILKTMKYKRK